MVFPKWVKYSITGAGILIGYETYHWICKKLVDKLRLDDTCDEINEVLFTRKSVDMSKALFYKIDWKENDTLRLMEVLENLINSSNKTIHLCMYIFTCSDLMEALKKASERGVKIYAVFDGSMIHSSNSQIENLQNLNISIKIETLITMHHKFCLIDVSYSGDKLFSSQNIAFNSERTISIPQSGILVTGSMNWTMEALTNNHENTIITSNAKLIESYATLFIGIWNSL